ncbi:MAG: ABC transporter permease [Eubacterium sp.]|nr:ABC transporter permease [Eubacterium sp.]
MNIVQKLTLRHIKSHKRRSFLTVLAIIVSVAMVTAVFTSVFSFVKFMQDSTKAYDGNWHAQLWYEELPEESMLKSDDYDYYLGANVFNFRYDKEKDTSKAYAEVDAVTEKAEEMRNINILDGAFPKNEGEILVTKEYIEKNKLNWKVGDTIRLYCLDYATEKEGYKEYKLCGIAQGNVSFFDHRDGVVAFTDSVRNSGVNCYATLSYHTLNNSVYEKTHTLESETNSQNIKFNIDLLNYSGVMENNETFKALGGFAAVILAVIVIASVIMIYDSFAVSYQERERYLGMLASVGATKRQKRSSIYFEGFILGIIGIVIGTIAGFIGMMITFKSIEEAFLTTISIAIKGTLKVHFSPYIILETVLISALTIFISCYIPARRASKTTPIAAIKGTNTVKVKKAKRLRVSKLTRKLYGYEGELAVKNFKRNGRRSRNIVFALVMSVVLFLTVTNFSQMFTSLVKNEAGEENADFIINTETEYKDKVKEYFDGVDIDSYIGYITTEATLVNTEAFSEDACRAFSLSEGEDITDLFIYVMDNASFDSYLKSIGEQPESYHNKNQLKALAFNRVIDVTGSKPKVCRAFKDGVKGKKLNCLVNMYNEETGEFDDRHDFSVTVGAMTDKEFESSLFQPKYVNEPSLIFSEDMISALPLERRMFNFGIFAKDYKNVMNAADEYFEGEGIPYSIEDSTSRAQSVNALLSIIKVFIYGFVTLLTLIAIINIINSISNSMNERKTEFAMLKSVGVTPKGFKKMIYVESIRYGVKSLLWSLPISAALHYLMFYALSTSEGLVMDFSPNLHFYLVAVLAVFVIIIISLLYSADKIKDDDIIENLKQD